MKRRTKVAEVIGKQQTPASLYLKSRAHSDLHPYWRKSGHVYVIVSSDKCQSGKHLFIISLSEHRRTLLSPKANFGVPSTSTRMMRQRRAERHEAKLEAERRVKCRGTARTKLEFLDFPKHGRNENAERLKLCMEYGGFHRLGITYHVIAVIDQWLLDALSKLPTHPIRHFFERRAEPLAHHSSSSWVSAPLLTAMGLPSSRMGVAAAQG